jgi:CheY-like chemotaxis protein
MNVLVVDDHPELRKMTAQFLQILGHACVQAGNRAEAEALVARLDLPLDVVLLDLHLGQSSGLPLAASLEQARPGLRTLFMSGLAHEERLASALAHPRRLFIAKPFTLEALGSALDRLARAA